MAGYVEPKNASEASPLTVYGDAAGEYTHMTRGRYGAWVYVGFAFFYQIAAIGGILCGISYAIARAAGARIEPEALFGIGALVAVPLAWLMFRDRWRCIEAFSSRSCSGVMNLSLIYVPIVALIYANVRGVQKLSGR
jgi:hypothetical protein